MASVKAVILLIPLKYLVLLDATADNAELFRLETSSDILVCSTIPPSLRPAFHRSITVPPLRPRAVQPTMLVTRSVLIVVAL